jgi:hypothetical protein
VKLKGKINLVKEKKYNENQNWHQKNNISIKKWNWKE